MTANYFKLLVDLQTLLDEAKDQQFSDFGNTKYAMPKVMLVNKLQQIINGVQRGDYDD